MTTDQVQAFLDAVKSNPALQAALRAPDADVVALAASLGFTVNMSDLVASMPELDEAELDAVAGGTQSNTHTPLLSRLFNCPHSAGVCA
jgi:predicted ribosomally synthesized peptide with nif11-like leader